MARVLVVDDEKMIVKGIRFSLEQDQMQVDCAYDGEEALELARKTEYGWISGVPADLGVFHNAYHYADSPRG